MTKRRDLLTGIAAAEVLFAAITSGGEMPPVHREKIAAKVRTWQARELRRRAGQYRSAR